MLDWFHFIETIFICVSLMVINRMSSFDLVYQMSLIGTIELVYYSLNIFNCIFLLYYQRWSELNITISVQNYKENKHPSPTVLNSLPCSSTGSNQQQLKEITGFYLQNTQGSSFDSNQQQSLASMDSNQNDYHLWFRMLEKYANMLRKNRRLNNVLDGIEDAEMLHMDS